MFTERPGMFRFLFMTTEVFAIYLTRISRKAFFREDSPLEDRQREKHFFAKNFHAITKFVVNRKI